MNYELGWKHTSADRRFSFAAAVFHIDWDDIQAALRVSGPTNVPVTYTGNAGAAAVDGVELEMHYQPIPGLTLALADTDARITETMPDAGRDGDRIPYTPEYSGSASADYEFTLTPAMDTFVGADVFYTGERGTTFESLPAQYLRLEDYYTFNARVGLDFGNSYRLTLAGRNLADEDAVIDRQITSSMVWLGLFRVPPRTVSLEFSAKF